jgi:hypothetical protein
MRSGNSIHPPHDAGRTIALVTNCVPGPRCSGNGPTDGLKAANPTLPFWIAYPTAGCPVADDDWLDGSGSGGGLSPNRPWFSAGAAASADGCRRECLEEQRLGHHASRVSPVEPEFGSCKRQICKWFRLDMAGALKLPSSSLKGCRRSAYTRSGLQQGEQRGSAKPIRNPDSVRYASTSSMSSSTPSAIRSISRCQSTSSAWRAVLSIRSSK